MTKNDILLKVKSSISNYLGFDVDDLFLKKYSKFGGDVDDAYIFGGSIRDSIADVPIYDVDILGRAESLNKIARFLINEHGFVLQEDYIKKSSNDIYSNGLIFEPHTYIKVIGNNNKLVIVQLIKPSNDERFIKTIINNKISYDTFLPELDLASKIDRRNTIDNLNKLIKDVHIDPSFKFKNQILNLNLIINNVDISCCGLSYSFDQGLREHHPNAIYHSLNKIYSLNKEAIMYNEHRIYARLQKMENKGFKEINEKNKSEIFKLNRGIKLFDLDI